MVCRWKDDAAWSLQACGGSQLLLPRRDLSLEQPVLEFWRCMFQELASNNRNGSVAWPDTYQYHIL